MFKKFLILTIFVMFTFFSFSDDIDSWTNIYNNLLKKYVKSGNKFGIDLKQRLESLPSIENLPVAKELSFWINVYNFLTLAKICEKPDIKSIKELGVPFKTSWQIPAGIVSGKTYTLDEIEHNMIEKIFKEPRVHFALNCSALSCPDLRNEAYFPDNLYNQLDDQLNNYVNNKTKGLFINDKKKTIYLSKIFYWYRADFKNDPKEWLYNKKLILKDVYNNYRLAFFDYDWRLNKY